MDDQNNNSATEDLFAGIFTGDATFDESPQVPQHSKQEEVEAIKEPQEQPQPANQEIQEEEPEAQETKKDPKREFETLKKRLDESKAWGHKNNMAFINSRKKMNEFLNKLHEDGAIFDEQLQEGLDIFKNASSIIPSESEKESDTDNSNINMFAKIKSNLDQELAMHKKYARTEDADYKYNSFFTFWSLFSPQEQDNLMNYFQEEKSEVAFDEVMRVGTELYDTLYKGMQEKGGLVPYVKSLRKQNDKLIEEVNKYKSELENTTEKVYNRSITSRASNAFGGTKQNLGFAEIWQAS